MEENLKKIFIGCDHAGFELKEHLKKKLSNEGYEVKDYGTFSPDSVDYPDIAHPLANDINSGKCDRAVLICGSGNGVSMVANKYVNVRAALCWTVEIAALARRHNNANILSLPARFISKDLADKILETFMKTDFEGGRHERRVDKIGKLI